MRPVWGVPSGDQIHPNDAGKGDQDARHEWLRLAEL